MRRVLACIAGVIVAGVGLGVLTLSVVAALPPSSGWSGSLMLFLLLATIAGYLLVALGLTMLRRGCTGRRGVARPTGTK